MAVVVGGGCRPYEPTEPVEQTAQACCTEADAALQHFSGCRVARGECRMRKGEKFWMRGRVRCGPVDEARCEGGRCCSYLPVYGSEADPPTAPGRDEPKADDPGPPAWDPETEPDPSLSPDS